jgi:hypothetical protein
MSSYAPTIDRCPSNQQKGAKVDRNWNNTWFAIHTNNVSYSITWRSSPFNLPMMFQQTLTIDLQKWKWKFKLHVTIDLYDWTWEGMPTKI